MKRTQGTPSSLNGAIWNGMISVATVFPQGGRELADAIEQHVLDYLRQKFGAAYLMMDELDGEIGLVILRELATQIGVERTTQPKEGTPK